MITASPYLEGNDFFEKIVKTRTPFVSSPGNLTSFIAFFCSRHRFEMEGKVKTSLASLEDQR
jgi:hypothetical protein